MLVNNLQIEATKSDKDIQKCHREELNIKNSNVNEIYSINKYDKLIELASTEDTLLKCNNSKHLKLQ